MVVDHAHRHYKIDQSALSEDDTAKFPEVQIAKLTTRSDDFCEFIGKLPEEMLIKLDQESEICKAYRIANPPPYITRVIPNDIQQQIEKQKVVSRAQGKRKATPTATSSPKTKKQKKQQKSKKKKKTTTAGLQDEDSEETESDANLRQSPGTQSPPHSPHPTQTSEPIT